MYQKIIKKHSEMCYNLNEGVIKMLSPTIETERLIMRRYQATDIDAFYDIITDKRLHKFIKFPSLSYSEESDYINKCIDNAYCDVLEKWTIVLKDTNEVIGNIAVNKIHERDNYCEVGYVLRYNYWGRGYTSEALKAISNYLLTKYYLVECLCDEDNIQSYRVMEKAGFIKDGYIPNRRLCEDGKRKGLFYYSKTKVE